jgi:hypothetical protein
MKYCRQRSELSKDEFFSQLGGLGAELIKKKNPLAMGHPVCNIPPRKTFRAL